jgi:hypothetical protein
LRRKTTDAENLQICINLLLDFALLIIYYEDWEGKRQREGKNNDEHGNR